MAAEGATVTSRVLSPNSQQGKASMSSRISGKQDEESQRRNQPPPKAWGSGVNPITQRSNTPSQSNGTVNKANAKHTVSNMGNSEETNHSRHVSILSHALGQSCTFVLEDGEVFVAIPVAIKNVGKSSDAQISCQMVRTGTQRDITSPQKQAGQVQYIGQGPHHSMVFQASEIVLITVPEAATPARSSAGKGFMTDTEISGNIGARERKLERWQAPTDNSPVLSNTGTAGEWDQFKVNQERFGVKSDYDESHYTTVIDRKNPNYSKLERKAARLAAEIEGDARSNAYNEQHGANDEDYNEEDLYSGVRRETTPLQSGQPNRYVPPSRRSQQAIGNESAVDPAIVSAQVARTEPVNEVKPAAGPGATTSQAQVHDLQADETPVTDKAPSAVVPALASDTKATAAAGPAQTKPTASAAINAPHNVHAAFKAFANLEKLKVQDTRRQKAVQDKAVKVNDLKKFAKNFKLFTPVPKDLLPILAKDQDKQNEIVKKANEQAEQSKAQKLQQAEQQRVSAEQTAVAKRKSESGNSSVLAKVAPPNTNTIATNVVANGLSQRLENSRRIHKQNNPMPVPQPLPIHEARGSKTPSYASGMSAMTSPTKMSNLRGPLSANSTKLNVQASEFRPNAMAAPFRPDSVNGTTNVSSPSSRPVTRSITPNAPQVHFLREVKARDAKGTEPKPITFQLEKAKTIKAIPVMKPPTANPHAASASKETGAPRIQQPFRYRVDWLDNDADGKEDELPKYHENFTKGRLSRQASYGVSAGNGPRVPQQMPYHMQNGGPNMHSTPMSQHMPPHMQGQPHHFVPGAHFDDHHIRSSPSIQSGYPTPSPRMQNVYPAPMAHGGQMGYPQPGYMTPGPHGMAPRQYSNGPTGMPGPHMQPPMMMPQGSAGPYMQQPILPMQPGNHYQSMYAGPPQSNGYPSPGRGAPPMIPSGSHSSHPTVYTPGSQYSQPSYHHPPSHVMPRGNYNNQPQYAQSPYPQHPYPARTPSHGYAQPHQQQHMMLAQAASAQPTVNNGDEKK